MHNSQCYGASGSHNKQSKQRRITDKTLNQIDVKCDTSKAGQS